MKFSINAIKRYCNVNDSIEKLADHLTKKVCEIEEIIIREISDKILIGKVTEVTKHPDADKLNVCQINCGSAGNFQIVTGGENVAPNKFVPVAIPGCFLSAINLEIQPRKMRGLDSIGMICSKEELGISEDSDKHRIWLLDEDFDDLSDADCGTPIKSKYPRLENIILDVDNKTLTNRPDLTGHRGIGNELYAIYKNIDKSKILFTKVKDYYTEFQNLTRKEIISKKINQTATQVKSEKVNSYCLIKINNINIGKSNFFDRLNLIDMGGSPHSNWVDFTNKFMLTIGQPIHCFDADKIIGEIIVREAIDGEKFIDLKGVEHTLSNGDIVIADSQKILALGGVIGGQNSQVDENTKNIIIEIANFDSIAIRKTGTRLGLRTDAELRFEKNINPAYSIASIMFLFEELGYMKKSLGDFNAEQIFYYESNNINFTKDISCSYDQLLKPVFGNSIGTQKIETSKEILVDLGFKISEGDNLVISSPIRRGPDDITGKHDLIEEVLRIWGYENIDSQPFMTTLQTPYISPIVELTREFEDILQKEKHFDQIETYPRVEEKYLELFNVDKNTLYSLKNPTAPERSYLRDNIVYGLLDCIQKNKPYDDKISIFEVGNIFANQEESTQLGLIGYQEKTGNWSEDIFLNFKGIVNDLLKNYSDSIKEDKSEKIRLNKNKQLSYKTQTGDEIGFVGQIHPEFLKERKIDINSQCVYACINLSKLKDLSKNNLRQGYETISSQIIQKDLSFAIDKETNIQNMISEIRKIDKITDLEMSDLFVGGNLEKGQSSITLRIKIIGDGNTTNEEIINTMGIAIKVAKNNGAILRGELK